ncbi:hypothetical protein Taro_005096 [Colocasia esculenta]|uniref:Inhibitor I9 domain-containing protein n=1 Tax=Colocasia esculenta TaxID=4460 RepID=A0A843TTN9_COLES|nr:hypothetical protein [Colocasia esculenta]
MRRGSGWGFVCLCCCVALVLSGMAKMVGAAASAPQEEAAVQIVYTERPEGVDPEDYHVRILASVLGSDEAAKEALIYSYKTAASGFSAKLTPQQVAEISKQPGVLQVLPSRKLQLHAGPARLN